MASESINSAMAVARRAASLLWKQNQDAKYQANLRCISRGGMSQVFGEFNQSQTASSFGGLIPGNLLIKQHLSSSATTEAAGRVQGRGLKGLMHDWKQLSKFKLSALVVLTSAGGFFAGSGERVDWAGLCWTALGTFGAAACANTLNQLYEVTNDSRMTRTCNRPLPAGRLTRLHAAGFAVAMGAAGLGILYEKTNLLTVALGASNILLYAGVYTPLKQISVVNTWVGALVGAIPPLMGWAAASGSLEAGSTVLAVALFSWQMPHFMALAWLCKDDYMRGGFKMLPSIDPQGRRTAAVALRHCLYLAPIGLLAVAAEVATWPFAIEAAAMSAAIGVYALRFAAAPSQVTARAMFKFSLAYLPALLVLMAVHRLPNNHSVGWSELADKAGATMGFAALGAFGPSGLMEGLRTAMNDVASRLDGDVVLTYVTKCPSKVLCKDLPVVEQRRQDRVSGGTE